MEPIVSPTRLQNGSNFLKGVLLPSTVILVVILGGAATGWFLSQKLGTNSGMNVGLDGYSKAPGATVSEGGKEVGSSQTNFKDQAEGTLQKGGIEGEGTHHLERTGGASQTVYLTSSVVDLDQFVGKKVQVSGETFSGKKAGWFMDVGKVKILE